MNDNSGENLTESEIRKMAYLKGMRMKNAGHAAGSIYAKFKRQGLKEDLAREIVKDLMIVRKREVIEKTKSEYEFALIRVGMGLIGALISILIFPENHVFPATIIAGGIIAALLAKKKINEQ